MDKSARHLDQDGRLHVNKSHISMAGINSYYGYELDPDGSKGLEERRSYRILRDPEALSQAVSTFERIPILAGHAFVNAENPKKEKVIGAIGSDVSFDAPYLDADTVIWDDQAITLINNGSMTSWSCSYHCTLDMTPGMYDGKSYDGKMIKIVGNHLALVEEGRAGTDVVIADEVVKIDEKRLFKMKRNKLKEGILAMDAELSPEQLDKVIDAALGVEQGKGEQESDNPDPEEPLISDSPLEQLRKLLQWKVDEETLQQVCDLFQLKEENPIKEMEKKDTENTAKIMDSLRRDLMASFEASKAVSPVVGEVLFDSASETYRYALKQMGVNTDGITEIAGLKALFSIASSTQGQARMDSAILQDSKQSQTLFPELNRIRNY